MKYVKLQPALFDLFCEEEIQQTQQKPTKTCLWCKEAFGQSKFTKFCSSSCYNYNFYKDRKKNYAEKDCAVCSTRYKPKTKNSETCSRMCLVKHTNAKKEKPKTLKPCRYCGNEFVGLSSRKFCRRVCGVKYHQEANLAKIKNKPKPVKVRILKPKRVKIRTSQVSTCLGCSELFIQTHHSKKFCSEDDKRLNKSSLS